MRKVNVEAGRSPQSLVVIPRLCEEVKKQDVCNNILMCKVVSQPTL